MEALVYPASKGDFPITDSRKVADTFGKRHGHVLDAIQKLVSQLPESEHEGLFIKQKEFIGFGIANDGVQLKRQRTYYGLTYTGFMLLVMGFTGPLALQLKLSLLRQHSIDTVADFLEEPPTPQKPIVYTYFILNAENNTLKIGRSTDVARRLKIFQAINSQPLRLLASVPENIEAHLHRVFSHLRVNNEWFEYVGELREFVSQVISNKKKPHAL